MSTTFDLNIDEIADGIWTGGDLPAGITPAVEALLGWRDVGITHIVDNRQECSDEQLVDVVAPDIAYLHAGVDDAGQRMPDSWFERTTRFALDALAADGVVLLHCHMGINRGPSAAYATLLTLGWDAVEAIDLIRSRRPKAAVGYAEDALAFWLREIDADEEHTASEMDRLAQWRLENPHDTVRIIRQIRNGQYR